MNKWYDIVHNKGSKEADILIYGVIGDSWYEESVTASQFRKDFKAIESEVDTINIRINTPGGSVWDGLAIYNTIEQSKKQTITYNDGIAYSMGAIILQAGDIRRSAKNGSAMTHDAITFAYGNAEEMRNTADMLDKITTGSIAQSLAARTGLSIVDVNKKFFNYKDNYWTAEEALAAGLIDEIVDYQIEKTFETNNLSYKEVVNKYIKFETKPPQNRPNQKIKNQNIPTMTKFSSLVALANLLDKGTTPSAADVAKAQVELAAENTGLIIVNAEKYEALVNASGTSTKDTEVVKNVTALFANSAETTFDLVAEIKNLQEENAELKGEDGDEIDRSEGEPIIPKNEKKVQVTDEASIKSMLSLIGK